LSLDILALNLEQNEQSKMAAARAGAPSSAGGGTAKTYQFKLVLLGESAVGKSSLVLRFVKDQFDDYRESTIGGEWDMESKANC